MMTTAIDTIRNTYLLSVWQMKHSFGLSKSKIQLIRTTRTNARDLPFPYQESDTSQRPQV